MRRSRNKYGARPTPTVKVGGKLRVLAAAGTDGHRFASKAEERRWRELKLLEKAGEIMDLEVHPRFPLMVNGVLIGSYTADSSYNIRATGEAVVEDVKALDKRTGRKPTMTEAYTLRKNLMWALYRVEVKEVSA